MNWFTKSFVANVSLSKKQALAQENDCCEHVEKDNSQLAVVSYENDSFGREGYGKCQACFDKAEEQADEQLHTCNDCKSEVPLNKGVMWRWYDFYAAQGDEPLFVCDCCRPLDKHQARVKRDQADRDWEQGLEEDDYGEVLQGYPDGYPDDNFTEEETKLINDQNIEHNRLIALQESHAK